MGKSTSKLTEEGTGSNPVPHKLKNMQEVLDLYYKAWDFTLIDPDTLKEIKYMEQDFNKGLDAALEILTKSTKWLDNGQYSIDLVKVMAEIIRAKK